jgi:hypothetical protein
VPYTDHYDGLDRLISHLDTVVPSLTDPFLRGHYVGFLAVSVVTVFELCIKEVLTEFAEKKHKTFGVYCSSTYEKMNGRIGLNDLKGIHVKKFGEKYLKKLISQLESRELEVLNLRRVSIKASYGNVIVWRNSYAHEGVLPANASYAETCVAYESGKEIIKCLASSMIR